MTGVYWKYYFYIILYCKFGCHSVCIATLIICIYMFLTDIISILGDMFESLYVTHLLESQNKQYWFRQNRFPASLLQ